MKTSTVADLERAVADLHHAASALAERWSSSARSMVTVGHERAVLRLLGVTGVDASGRPLAARVVERWLAGDTGRLGDGILLPFCLALVEYDLDPQGLALEVAAGRVELAMEAPLLEQPGRRAAVEAEANRLVGAGLERIDANRVARRELIAALGDLPRPWVGTSIMSSTAQEAIHEAGLAVRAGADLLRVDVPTGRELAARLEDAGLEVPRWTPPDPGSGPLAGAAAEPPTDVAPAGSQRGLAGLRLAADLAAVERGGYIRLATRPPALSAPEAAVVAALERIDLVECDPIHEIVGVGLEPSRVLADHALARRLHQRSGAAVLLGPGPLVVAPDLAMGIPGGAGARAGRALALQLIGARLAVADGLAPAQVLVGVIPGWLIDERDGFALAAAELALRRALLSEHPLAFAEPVDSPQALAWPYLLGALLPRPPVGALILRSAPAGSFAPVAATTRAAAAVAAALGRDAGLADLGAEAMAHALASVEAARETVAALAGTGWAAVTEAEPGWAIAAARVSGSGHHSVAPRSNRFDPLARLLEPAAG